MSNKKSSEKLRNDIHQQILHDLLKHEDNRYCVDCDGKGPRWASWNLGIFLCIRCAGIHRNLGVHISKVKSVNLDSWTPEQIAMMKEMGNSRGRAIYEAGVSDDFRRPQTDSTVEQFIRAKYEMKRYMAQGYQPVKPDIEAVMREIHFLEQQHKRKPGSGLSVPLPRDFSGDQAIRRPVAGNGQPPPPPLPVNNSAPVKKLEEEDLFGDFLNSRCENNGTPMQQTPSNDLLGLDFGAGQSQVDAGQANQTTKESILALFAQSNATNIPQAGHFNTFNVGQSMPSQPPPPASTFLSNPSSTQWPTSPPAATAAVGNQPNYFVSGFDSMAPSYNQLFATSTTTVPQPNPFNVQKSNCLADLNFFDGKQPVSNNNKDLGNGNGSFHASFDQAFPSSNTSQFTNWSSPAGQLPNANPQSDYLASIQSKLASLNVKQNS